MKKRMNNFIPGMALVLCLLTTVMAGCNGRMYEGDALSDDQVSFVKRDSSHVIITSVDEKRARGFLRSSAKEVSVIPGEHTFGIYCSGGRDDSSRYVCTGRTEAGRTYTVKERQEGRCQGIQFQPSDGTGEPFECVEKNYVSRLALSGKALPAGPLTIYQVIDSDLDQDEIVLPKLRNHSDVYYGVDDPEDLAAAVAVDLVLTGLDAARRPDYSEWAARGNLVRNDFKAESMYDGFASSLKEQLAVKAVVIAKYNSGSADFMPAGFGMEEELSQALHADGKPALLIHPRYYLNDKASAIYLSVKLSLWNPESDDQTDFRPVLEFVELLELHPGEQETGQTNEHAKLLKERVEKVTRLVTEQLATALSS